MLMEPPEQLSLASLNLTREQLLDRIDELTVETTLPYSMMNMTADENLVGRIRPKAGLIRNFVHSSNSNITLVQSQLGVAARDNTISTSVIAPKVELNASMPSKTFMRNSFSSIAASPAAPSPSTPVFKATSNLKTDKATKRQLKPIPRDSEQATPPPQTHATHQRSSHQSSISTSVIRRREELDCEKSAVLIQKHIRGSAARERYHAAQKLATVLQKQYRIQLQRRPPHWHEMCLEDTRTEMIELAEDSLCEELDRLIQHPSDVLPPRSREAKKIQKVFRGYSARKRVAHHREQLKTKGIETRIWLKLWDGQYPVPRWLRYSKASLETGELTPRRLAALPIQCAYRQHRSRGLADQKRIADRRERSAATIQYFWKNCPHTQVKKARATQRRTQEEVERQARLDKESRRLWCCEVIQKAGRGHAARVSCIGAYMTLHNRMLELRARVLQRWFKGLVCRSRFKVNSQQRYAERGLLQQKQARDFAAKNIQRVFRGYRSRKANPRIRDIQRTRPSSLNVAFTSLPPHMQARYGRVYARRILRAWQKAKWRSTLTPYLRQRKTNQFTQYRQELRAASATRIQATWRRKKAEQVLAVKRAKVQAITAKRPFSEMYQTMVKKSSDCTTKESIAMMHNSQSSPPALFQTDVSSPKDVSSLHADKKKKYRKKSHNSHVVQNETWGIDDEFPPPLDYSGLNASRIEHVHASVLPSAPSPLDLADEDKDEQEDIVYLERPETALGQYDEFDDMPVEEQSETDSEDFDLVEHTLSARDHRMHTSAVYNDLDKSVTVNSITMNFLDFTTLYPNLDDEVAGTLLNNMLRMSLKNIMSLVAEVDAKHVDVEKWPMAQYLHARCWDIGLNCFFSFLEDEEIEELNANWLLILMRDTNSSDETELFDAFHCKLCDTLDMLSQPMRDCVMNILNCSDLEPHTFLMRILRLGFKQVLNYQPTLGVLVDICNELNLYVSCEPGEDDLHARSNYIYAIAKEILPYTLK